MVQVFILLPPVLSYHTEAYKGKSSGSVGIHLHNTDINIARTDAAFTLTAFPPFNTQQTASVYPGFLAAEYLLDPARITGILVLVHLQPRH